MSPDRQSIEALIGAVLVEAGDAFSRERARQFTAAAGLFVSPAPGPVLANYGLDTLRFVKPASAPAGK